MSMADGLVAIAVQAAGALGLFLLGMGLMSEGLRQAAGPALRHLLCAATRTRAQALGSGILVTALVQSSSAVTVATIGFVNAGLLALGPALWVLFGANVGTTMTGWIVATIGLKFKIETLAMPLIGLGALLRLTGQGQRVNALGTALAGFGLLFLGIALLQQTFGSLSAHLTLPQGEGASAVLARIGIGLLMTVLMQSSSAAMAITLTAAQGGLIDAQGAAAVVIGANIGTTATALMTTPGATPNAHRAAWAHVAFNLITAVVALLLLPGLTAAVGLMGQLMAMPPDAATQLALFHTLFNLLGVLLMWPLADRMTRALMQRWRSREEDEAAPVFLDDSVLIVPALALEAPARCRHHLRHRAVRSRGSLAPLQRAAPRCRAVRGGTNPRRRPMSVAKQRLRPVGRVHAPARSRPPPPSAGPPGPGPDREPAADPGAGHAPGRCRRRRGDDVARYRSRRPWPDPPPAAP